MKSYKFRFCLQSVGRDGIACLYNRDTKKYVRRHLADISSDENILQHLNERDKKFIRCWEEAHAQII